MSPTKRIYLNFIATYGRSLYGLLCGLITGRWTLMAMGAVDLGLIGVTGGLTAFISFFNGVMASALGRFYAFSVGQASVAKDPQEGLEECRRWFSVAVLIHTVIPLTLMVIGYPIGIWAVRNFLTIPPDRIETCVWIFRIACFTCLFGMMTVPLCAMYGAKQYIAELTIYSFVTTTINIFFLYYMITHPGVWILKYYVWTTLLGFIPHAIIAIRAYFLFPECRFRWMYCLDYGRMKQVANYAGWQTFGWGGRLVQGQGISVLINKYFGPAVNTALGIAQNIDGKANMLVGSLMGALAPAITTACGAGDYDKVRRFANRASKCAMMMAVIFLVPLSLELPEIVTLWLKNPPEYAIGLCWIVMLMSFVDRSTLGFTIAINATGKIAKFQLLIGMSLMMILPLAWLFCALGFSPYYVGFSMVAGVTGLSLLRLPFAKKLVGVNVGDWFRHVLAPVLVTIIVSAAFGVLPRLFLPTSFWRIVLTTVVSEFAILPLGWFVVLDSEERQFVSNNLREKVFARFFKDGK